MIVLNKPYIIIPTRLKRYAAHYNIPAAEVVVVPLKALGTESSCDVRWEDQNGELQVLQNLMFSNENLVPLNPLLNKKLYELWSHYYQTEAQPNEQ